MPSLPDRFSGATLAVVTVSAVAALALFGATRLDRLTPGAGGMVPLVLLSLLSLLLLAATLHARRRTAELRLEVERHRALDVERDRLVQELDAAVTRVRTLQGILSMCSWCKSIRDPGGEWLPLEVYLEDNFQAHLSHGVCPECMRVQYPTLFES